MYGMSATARVGHHFVEGIVGGSCLVLLSSSPEHALRLLHLASLCHISAVWPLVPDKRLCMLLSGMLFSLFGYAL